MKPLTFTILKNINEDYDYNYSDEILKKIQKELTLLPSIITMEEILEEFEVINE